MIVLASSVAFGSSGYSDRWQYCWVVWVDKVVWSLEGCRKTDTNCLDTTLLRYRTTDGRIKAIPKTTQIKKKHKSVFVKDLFATKENWRGTQRGNLWSIYKTRWGRLAWAGGPQAPRDEQRTRRNLKWRSSWSPSAPSLFKRASVKKQYWWRRFFLHARDDSRLQVAPSTRLHRARWYGDPWNQPKKSWVTFMIASTIAICLQAIIPKHHLSSNLIVPVLPDWRRGLTVAEILFITWRWVWTPVHGKE
jgi:hypothetical protein